MFQHSYNEMQYIVLGAADWVENVLYDPLKASETTAYFRSINATRNEVLEYSDALKEHIMDIGIDIIDVDYDTKTHPYYEDETRIYSMIAEKYAATNPHFDEAAQKKSMEFDARSLSHIYVLRKGQAPMRISDCGYLFITANRSLNRVAADFHRLSGKLERSLPASVTDVFLGTYIWLSDPVKITEMNERLMIANAYLAFQPNSELVSKLSSTVNTLLKKGEISSDTCYALMGNRLVLDRLAEKTLGDPEAYHESTPLEILQEMMEESRQAGEADAEKRFDAWKQQNAIEQAALHQKHMQESTAINTDLVHMTKIALDSARHELQSMRDNRKIASRYRKKWKVGTIIACILWFVLNIAVSGFVWKYDIAKASNWLDLVTVIIEVILFAVPFIFTCITNREFNVPRAITKFLDKRYERKCEKLGCSDEALSAKVQLVAELDEKLGKFSHRFPAA